MLGENKRRPKVAHLESEAFRAAVIRPKSFPSTVFEVIV